MTYEVYINDKMIEISNPKMIGLTFQVGSIFDISGRSGNLSNKFKVPFTLINQQVLGNLSNINADNNLPYQRNTAKIVQNGIEIVPNGFAIIDSTSDGYDITIYSGNVSFFDLIKDLNVNDLDFDDLNHLYTSLNQKISWETSLKYIYPIIEWGQKTTNLLVNSAIVHVEDFIPCLYFKTILDRTLIFLGYSLTGLFKDSAEYNGILVSPQNFGMSDDDANVIDGKAYNVGITQYIENPLVNNIEHEIPIIFDTFSQVNFTSQNYTPTNDIWGQLFLDINTNIRFDSMTTYSFQSDIRVVIYEDGVEILSSSVSRTTIVNTSPPPVLIDMETPFFWIKSTSVYSFKYFATHRAYLSGSPYPSYSGKVFYDWGGTYVWYIGSSPQYTNLQRKFEVKVKRVITINNEVPMSFLYDVTVADLLLDLMNFYCLVIQTNEITKEVALNRMDEIIANKVNAKDWSDKVDATKKPMVKYQFGSYARENILKFIEVDGVSKNAGKGQIIVNDENIIKTKTLIETKSATAETIKKINNYDVPNIPVKIQRIEALKDVKQRFFNLDRKVENITYRYSSTNTFETSFNTNYLPIAVSLDFPSLITANYQALQSMLDKMKIVNIYFRLQETDVVDIDFTIPIYLDVPNINGYFYINKISNFKVDSSTLVELIRL